jgi:hypothetical protein
MCGNDELVDAVRWERECEEFFDATTNMCIPVSFEWDQVVYAARAEVDRLLSASH